MRSSNGIKPEVPEGLRRGRDRVTFAPRELMCAEAERELANEYWECAKEKQEQFTVARVSL